MINRSNSRLSPEYVLLGFLYKLPSYGYVLHRQLLEEFGNIWHSSQSQTYNIIKRLDAQGHVTSTYMEQEKHPPRQQLCITESGKRRFEDWLNHPTKSSVHAIRVEFVTRLYFMQLYYPQNTQDMIGVQIEIVNAEILLLQKDLADLPSARLFNRLALELRIKLLISVISWLKESCVMFGA